MRVLRQLLPTSTMSSVIARRQFTRAVYRNLDAARLCLDAERVGQHVGQQPRGARLEFCDRKVIEMAKKEPVMCAGAW